MKRLIPLLLLLTCFQAKAVFVDALVVLTNAPNVGSNWTVNGSSRLWTNSQTATTIQTNTASVLKSTTNLVSQIQAYPYGGLSFRWYSPTSFFLSGSNITITIPGAWAGVVYTTNSGPVTVPLMVPPNNVTGLTNRTNNASWIVDYLNRYKPTNFLEQASGAMIQFLNLGQIQSATNKTFRSSTNIGGYTTNQEARRFWTRYSASESNGFGFADAGGTIANQFVADSFGVPLLLQADGSASEPSDPAHILTLYWAQQIFPGLTYTNVWGGTNFFASKTWFDVPVDTTNSFNVGGTNIGVFSTNETFTSSTFTGNTNIWAGAVAYPINLISGLANGNNSDVKVTNKVNLLMGPTGPFTNTGFVHAFGNREGIEIEVMNTNGFPMAFLNQSGLEGNANYRIITGTGGTVVITNNPGTARLRYDNTFYPGRWILVGKTD